VPGQQADTGAVMIAAKQGSISFLKKRNKKLFIPHSTLVIVGHIRRASAKRKSFLVLFFKKELLPSHLPSFGIESPQCSPAS
jgi:hypothetical protein